MQPVVPVNNPKPENARADMDPAGMFAALDRVVAHTPLATRLRTQGAAAASTLKGIDSEEPQPVRSAPVPSEPTDLAVVSGSVNESRLHLDGSANPRSRLKL